MLWARRFLTLKEPLFAKYPSRKSPLQKKNRKEPFEKWDPSIVQGALCKETIQTGPSAKGPSSRR